MTVCNKNPTSPYMADVKRNTSGHVGMKLNSREKYKKNIQNSTDEAITVNQMKSQFNAS